jgi:hypothetical protein
LDPLWRSSVCLLFFPNFPPPAPKVKSRLASVPSAQGGAIEGNAADDTTWWIRDSGAVDFCAADCYGEPRIHVRCPLTAISSIREMPERMNTPYTPIQAAVEAIAEQAGTVGEDFHSGRPRTYNKEQFFNPSLMVRLSDRS